MIKGIIFDLDGTLISEREYVLGCLKHTATYVEQTYGTKDTYFKLKAIFEEKWEKLFNRYFEQEGIAYEDSDIQRLIAIYRETVPITKLYPDVVETLTKLRRRGVKLALLTNGFYPVQKKKIETADLEQFFDLIVIPDEFSRDYWKPSQWGYDQIIHSFDIEPKKIMAVGDMEHDFIVPKAMGMSCVYLEREDRMKDLNPDVRPERKINSLKEMDV